MIPIEYVAEPLNTPSISLWNQLDGSWLQLVSP